MGVPNYCPINVRVEIVRREEAKCLMIFPPTSVGGRPPFIFSSFTTCVPKSGMMVGEGAMLAKIEDLKQHCNIEQHIWMRFLVIY